MNPRFFCAAPMRVGSALQLPSDIAHHAVRVLRLRSGAPIVLFDGSGGEYLARLQTEGRSATAIVEAHDCIERESLLELVLVQALPAGDKLDWIVEKAVELGVSAVVPVIAERSVVRLSGERAEKRLAHLRGVVRAACEQCGRNRLPDVEPIETLGACLARSRDWSGERFVLAPGGGAPQAGAVEVPRKVSLLVGPEGGWSDAEMKAIRSAGWTTMVLGPRILRTETAGLAAVAAMQSRWGDFRLGASET